MGAKRDRLLVAKFWPSSEIAPFADSITTTPFTIVSNLTGRGRPGCGCSKFLASYEEDAGKKVESIYYLGSSARARSYLGYCLLVPLRLSMAPRAAFARFPGSILIKEIGRFFRDCKATSRAQIVGLQSDDQ